MSTRIFDTMQLGFDEGYKIGFKNGENQGKEKVINACLKITEKIITDFNDYKIPIDYGTICAINIKLENMKDEIK